MPEHEPDPKVKSYLDKLAKLDAGDKAKLKRDASKPIAEAQSIGLFYRLLPYGLNATQEEAYFLVATLYGLADGGAKGNLGASLHRARDPKNHKGLDRRVEILLDSDARQLAFRLRQTVRFLKSNRVKVNWQQLLEDLLRWNYSSRTVQKQWARAYFALPKPTDDDASAEDENNKHS
jgi:CRISPR type I-E-associated protein CasB/Cse2